MDDDTKVKIKSFEEVINVNKTIQAVTDLTITSAINKFLWSRLAGQSIDGFLGSNILNSQLAYFIYKEFINEHVLFQIKKISAYIKVDFMKTILEYLVNILIENRIIQFVFNVALILFLQKVLDREINITSIITNLIVDLGVNKLSSIKEIDNVISKSITEIF